MNEAQFQTKFSHWMDENEDSFPMSQTFEYKVTKTDSFDWKNWIKKLPHQLTSLLMGNKKKTGLYYKIPDVGNMKKPLDAIRLRGVQGYLVVYFNKRNEFLIVEAEKILDLIHSDKPATYNKLLEMGRRGVFH